MCYRLTAMFSEYKKIDFDKPEHNQNEAGNTEDQIYYHGKTIS